MSQVDVLGHRLVGPTRCTRAAWNPQVWFLFLFFGYVRPLVSEPPRMGASSLPQCVCVMRTTPCYTLLLLLLLPLSHALSHAHQTDLHSTDQQAWTLGTLPVCSPDLCSSFTASRVSASAAHRRDRESLSEKTVQSRQWDIQKKKKNDQWFACRETF